MCKEDNESSASIGLAAVKSAIAYGGDLYGEATNEDFNAAFDHILNLPK